MDVDHLIDQGNTLREQRRPLDALACYAQAFVANPDSPAAWNNYGNVMRECGQPFRAIPFLEHAIRMMPDYATAKFNLAVTYLLLGEYDLGWKLYESRWNYEHLAGTLPQYQQPRWTGQDIKGKKILVLGEQGLGDTVQFCRYSLDLGARGARIILKVPYGIVPLFGGPSDCIEACVPWDQDYQDFDYWCPSMSLPGVLGVNLQNLHSPIQYITPDKNLMMRWNDLLGKKTRLRVGLSWSGRRDTWINQHKSVPLPYILDLVRRCPQFQWINLQVDATAEESQQLTDAGVATFPNSIQHMGDTAGLISNLDVTVSIDSAVSHLSGALGRPTWVMLNSYGTDWRWLLNRSDSPWYPTVRLFRQPAMDQWQPVIENVARHLDLFKI